MTDKINIDIISQPIFWLLLDEPTVDALITLAMGHYDGHCKSTARLGGFLWGWRNSVHFDATVKCRATWRDLDTSMKICEAVFYNDSAELRTLVEVYRSRVIQAVTAAREAAASWSLSL